jgi:hypothetical protein
MEAQGAGLLGLVPKPSEMQRSTPEIAATASASTMPAHIVPPETRPSVADASNQTDAAFPTLTKWLPAQGRIGPVGDRPPPFGLGGEANVPCYTQPYSVTQEIRKMLKAKGDVPYFLQNAQVSGLVHHILSSIL